jgi:hypothetical protein
MPITVWYIGDGSAYTDCSTVTSGWILMPDNMDNVPVRCLKVEGLAIQKHHKASVHVAYEFRWKGTPGNWGSSSVDPTTQFRAGFNFKSQTVITLDGTLYGPPSDLQARFMQQLNRLPMNVRPDYQARFDALWHQSYTGNHALGLTFAGEKMTAVGGFVFDPSGAGRANVTVRLFKTAPSSSNRCNTAYDDSPAQAQAANLAGWYTTSSDGFYFIWQKDIDNTALSGGTNTLASGFKYYVALCDFTSGTTAMPFAQLYWPARSMSDSLGNKEFDEEDFFVSGPTRLTYTAQPTSGKVNKTLGQVKVALLDGFGNVMTMDTGSGASSITLSLMPGPSGTLWTATFTRQLVNGVATWTDLKISAPADVYRLKAMSSISGIDDQSSLPINITP